MEIVNWVKDVGKQMKYERKSWGMSRRRLERLSHVDRYTIEEIENGIEKNPDLYDMLNLCDVLETSIFFYLKDGKL